MSNKCAIEKNNNVQISWPKVLADAEVALSEAKARVRAIKRSIVKIKEKIANREAFPMSSS
jgi:hypothetical protein